MENENKSIHEFDFNLICDYFSGLERQGPGSTEVTIKALSFIDHLTAQSCIADIGCGTGGQTMTLARHTEGKITAIDLFPQFIEQLNANAAKLNLQERVRGIVGNMECLPFQEQALDLIWSEGAIYNIGYERGLREWHKYLKQDGYVAVTEATWFTEERPAEIHDFWMDAYPQIDTIPNKVAQLQSAGYVPVAHFILPEQCWTDHFYTLQVARQEEFLSKHAGNPTVSELINNQRHEAMLYRQYKAFYGYVFYVGMKI